MKVTELLPVGSVVLLKDAIKKIVVIGIFPTQELPNKKIVGFEYVGVPYPEGYVGNNSALFFNHEDIDTVEFRGYENSERSILFEALQKAIDNTDALVGEKKNSIKRSEKAIADDIF